MDNTRSERARAWAYLEPYRWTTSHPEIADNWTMSSPFRPTLFPRSLEDHWRTKQVEDRISPAFDTCEEAKVGDWVVGQVNDSNFLNPGRTRLKLPVGTGYEELLADFQKIELINPERQARMILRFAKKYGMLGTGMVGFRDERRESTLYQAEAVRYGLLEPLAYWSLEVRAVKAMSNLRAIACSPNHREALKLREQMGKFTEWFPNLSSNEQSMLCRGARSLMRVHTGLEEAIRRVGKDNLRLAAREAYVDLVNGALRQHSRTKLTDEPHAITVEVTGAYGLIYYALGCDLSSRSPRRVCARPGCGELIGPGRHFDSAYCGTSKCDKARYRAGVRQRTARKTTSFK